MMSTAAAARSSGSSRFPFTASQWQELEHQALIFKYMVSGVPIPPDLLYTVRRSLDSSISSKLLFHQPQLGWNCFQMGYGRKIDPEPGRCRRTDGKKWRCSKEAYPDSKYCERHMHRGRNRSRKPVELMTQPPPPPPISSCNNTSASANPPTAVPIISSICTKTTNNFSPSCSPTSHHSFSCLTSLAAPPSHSYTSSTSSPHFNNHPNFLYSHSSSSRPPPGNGFSSQENAATNFLLDPSCSAYSHGGSKSYSYGQVAKEEVDHEHAFFSEPSGSIRNISGSQMDDSSWQLTPLTMGSSPLGHMKQQRGGGGGGGYSGHCSNYLQLQSLNNNETTRSMSSRTQSKHQFYPMGGSYDHDNKNHEMGLMLEREDHQPKKVMHHFFDEWPPKDKGNSWLDHNNNNNNTAAAAAGGGGGQCHDKYSSHIPVSKIQLSISMPNSNSNPSSHDFFMTTTRNDK